MGITIMISDKNWECLNKMKKRGESFDEVLTRLIKQKEGKNEKSN